MTSSSILPSSYRIRSYVGRNSRITSAQRQAYEACWPILGINEAQGQVSFDHLFAHRAPCYLEIGFGSGQSLVKLALSHPELNFIGVETHKPGLGAICLAIKERGIANIRLFHGDAIDLLGLLPNESLFGSLIFFPDPWPKRRHHERRLIKPAFLSLLLDKLRIDATVHLATDSQEYADQMMAVLSAHPALYNLAGVKQYAPRSVFRPVITKFEKRALRERRLIWELQFAKR